MRKIIQQHLLVSFYVMTLILSLFLLPLHFVFKNIGDYSVSFTQYSPAIAVLFIWMVTKDKTILSEINSRLSLKPGIEKWFLPAILIPSSCIIISSLFLSYLKIPYVSWSGNFRFYALNIVAILLGCIAEEIGWRGFLLPRLQRKYSPIVSSLIVGILWGVWHVNFTGGVPGFILYNLTMIEMSVLMTWLFNKTNGNLLLMITWHFVFNLLTHIFLWERFGIALFMVESIVFGIACIVILFADKEVFLKRIS